MRKHGRNCRDYLANILCIWSAGRERSYEGIGFISVALVWGYKSQGRCSKVQKSIVQDFQQKSTKKMTYAIRMPFFIIFLSYFYSITGGVKIYPNTISITIIATVSIKR